jgi:glutathione S-transferase
MVLHEKGIDFDVHEVDLGDKSEEFLSVSPYGKVPVLRVNGSSLYESNIVNEYLDEVYDSPRLMPENPELRASVRSWMAFADDYFFPSVYRVRMGPQRGYSKELIQEARERLDDALSRLEHQLENREYLVGEYTLADIAHAGNFHRLRNLAESGDFPLRKYPNVMAWIERVEARQSYKSSVKRFTRLLGLSASLGESPTLAATTTVARARTREPPYRSWTPSPGHETPQGPLPSGPPPWLTCSCLPTATLSSAGFFPWPWPSLRQSLSCLDSLLWSHGSYPETSEASSSA